VRGSRRHEAQTFYSVGATALAWPPVYDKDANLFFETQNDTTRQTYLLELTSESSTLATISLPTSVAIYSPSGTTWDGKFVGVTDEEYKAERPRASTASRLPVRRRRS
jgi:hypothetical protein